MSEPKDIFNIAPVQNIAPQRTLLDLLPKDSLVLQRLKDVAVEINRGRTDKEYHYLLKDDEHYSNVRRLRHQFWNVYNSTIGLDKAKMPISSIYAGIVSSQAFHEIMKCDIRATYILSQPHDIKAIQKDLLYEGYRYLDEIMQIPVMDHRGRPDHKAIQTKINIIKMMEDRISGSVVQREQKHIVNEDVKYPMESQENLDRLKLEVDKLKRSLGKQVEDIDFKEIDA